MRLALFTLLNTIKTLIIINLHHINEAKMQITQCKYLQIEGTL